MAGLSWRKTRQLTLDAVDHEVVNRLMAGYRPGAETIIVVPGGMGSQLDRSLKKHPEKLPYLAFDPIWMDLGLIFDRDAEELTISPTGVDWGDHVVVPNGPLRFPTLDAYDGAEDYFRRICGFNFGVFGWDWRRSLIESAMRLMKVLEDFRERVRNKHGTGVEPLARTTLFAHSQGGLVAKIFLSILFPGGNPSESAIDRRIGRVITTATPFYGTGTHQDRYYAGQDPVNLFYGAEKVAEIVGSLPGPYSLMMLGARVYEDHFQGGPLAGTLDRYPMRKAEDPGGTGDPDDPARWRDPFDPANVRYFPPVFSRRHMLAAAQEMQVVAQPLPAPVAKRLYNLRSGLARMPVEIHWQPVDGATFRIGEDPNPLDFVSGPGDGTVPYWSARLAWTPDENVFDMTRAKDHFDMAEHEEPLRTVHTIVRPGETAPAASRTRPERAGQARADAFALELASGAVAQDDPRLADSGLIRKLVEDGGLC